MVSRREFLGALSAAPVQAASKKRPNFVFLLTDDQRFDTVGALGNSEVRTPNMDRLVRRGVSFTHCQTQGGLTGAICMPSRAQIMTGRTVFQVHKGIVDHQETPDPQIQTFPERLRAHGYTTFHTGKWHNGPKLFQRSFSDGGNIFFGGMGDHLKLNVFDYARDGSYAKDRSRVSGEFSSQLFANTACDFLRRRDKSKPFLCNIAFTSPHDPRMAPQRFAGQFSPERVSLPRNFLPEHPFDNGEMKIRDELLAPFPRTADVVWRHIADYFAMIAEVDNQIGRVLDALEESGEYGNTYVIFAGDNGLAVGQHGLFGKQNLYDHSIRVPLVISGPGIPKGKRNPSLCHLMDLGPTICDAAGVDFHGVAGKSLLMAARSGRTLDRAATISAYRDFQRCVRTHDWKLIEYNVQGTRTAQLFDLKHDPIEMNNLANEPNQRHRVAEMRKLLAAGLKAAGDRAEWAGT